MVNTSNTTILLDCLQNWWIILQVLLETILPSDVLVRSRPKNLSWSVYCVHEVWFSKLFGLCNVTHLCSSDVIAMNFWFGRHGCCSANYDKFRHHTVLSIQNWVIKQLHPPPKCVIPKDLGMILWECALPMTWPNSSPMSVDELMPWVNGQVMALCIRCHGTYWIGRDSQYSSLVYLVCEFTC